MNARYAIGGHEEFPVLRLQPVDDDQGIDIPETLYRRWLAARAELDAVQRDILDHIRRTVGGLALPPELREGADHPADEPASDRPWYLA